MPLVYNSKLLPAPADTLLAANNTNEFCRHNNITYKEKCFAFDQPVIFSESFM